MSRGKPHKKLIFIVLLENIPRISGSSIPQKVRELQFPGLFRGEKGTCKKNSIQGKRLRADTLRSLIIENFVNHQLFVISVRVFPQKIAIR
jgi:predicted glycosyltransferase